MQRMRRESFDCRQSAFPAQKMERLRTHLWLQGGPQNLTIAAGNPANRQSGSEKVGPQNLSIAAGNPANRQSGSEKGKPQNPIIAAGNPANRQSGSEKRGPQKSEPN